MDILRAPVTVYVPHDINGPELATRIALIGHDPIYVTCLGRAGYPRFLGWRWRCGDTWINVEQDVVPWPGAIDSLMECPSPWCAYAYDTRYRMEGGAPGDAVYLGCTKISAELMAATPDAWDWRDASWTSVDTRLSTVARRAGFDVHQHFPGVTNANPNLVHRAELAFTSDASFGD